MYSFSSVEYRATPDNKLPVSPVHASPQFTLVNESALTLKILGRPSALHVVRFQC